MFSSFYLLLQLENSVFFLLSSSTAGELCSCFYLLLQQENSVLSFVFFYSWTNNILAWIYFGSWRIVFLLVSSSIAGEQCSFFKGELITPPTWSLCLESNNCLLVSIEGKVFS